jgi:hypothetical protein
MISVGKTEGKRPLGRPKRRWKDTIKMDIREVGCEGVSWIQLAVDMVQRWALVNTIGCNEPPDPIKDGDFDQLSDCRLTKDSAP